nr:Chain E, AKAP79 peptide [Homo sapiens]
EPIAIIITDTE